MKTIKIQENAAGDTTGNLAPAKLNRLKDMLPNVGFKDAVIRFGITILIPMLLLLIDKHLIIYAAPLMAYLLVSAIGHFCVVKFLWHRYAKKESAPVLPPYGTDPNYPEESV